MENSSDMAFAQKFVRPDTEVYRYIYDSGRIGNKTRRRRIVEFYECGSFDHLKKI